MKNTSFAAVTILPQAFFSPPKRWFLEKTTCHIWGMLNFSLMWELICPIWTSIPQSASGPEINATRKVTFQVALFGKDHPKSGLATYHQFPNNNATRKATLQVVFQVPEFPSGFLRYDALNIHYHCALLYSPSSIIYPVYYAVLTIPRSTSKVDFVILQAYNIPCIYLVKFQTLLVPLHLVRE